MEKVREDRVEPKVEVGYEPRGSSSSSGYQKNTSPSSLKKWALGMLLLLAMAGLVFGLWMAFQSGIISFQNQSQSLEIKSLKEAVEKQKSEISLYKNGIQSLQEGQKNLLEQVTTLKDQVAGLAKKPESSGDKNASSGELVYMTQKGDTLYSIAKKFKVRPEDIRRWNGLPLKKNPKPGHKITLHPPNSS